MTRAFSHQNTQLSVKQTEVRFIAANEEINQKYSAGRSKNRKKFKHLPRRSAPFDDEFKSDLDGHNDIFFSQRVMGHSVNHVSGIADSQKASKNNVFV